MSAHFKYFDIFYEASSNVCESQPALTYVQSFTNYFQVFYYDLKGVEARTWGQKMWPGHLSV